MAQRDDLLKGTAIGIGLTVLVPVAVAVVIPVVRPLVRSLVKAGIHVYERGREVVEEFGEAVDDVRAEVQQELFEFIRGTPAADLPIAMMQRVPIAPLSEGANGGRRRFAATPPVA